MGNDGGSISKRSEVVKTKKKKVRIDKHIFAQARKLCSLTKEPLRAPLVVCKRGLIYNKE